MDKGDYCNSNKSYLHLVELAARCAVESCFIPSECAENLSIQYECPWAHHSIRKKEKGKKGSYYGDKKKEMFIIHQKN